MNTNLLFDFTVNKENNEIKVKRAFAADVDLVWNAWTKPEILDQWWAPKPWRAETKTMDFKEGGYRLYAMVSPENEKHWSIMDYTMIDPEKSFSYRDGFCDEQGNINAAMPRSSWTNSFSESDGTTLVDVTIIYDKLEDLEKIISMGFKEGFTMGLGNLDQYIEAQFRLRKELKTNNMPKVTTYLNFPGNTEEAMNFYKSVFKTEFSGRGLQRFGDIPQGDGQPPVAESVKKMILHAELPITAGHVLMATDAPKEMGFELIQGNNMHICIDLDNRDETERIFNALSAGGKITMPLQDMFFGSYFGQFSDKYGINWMLNCQNK